MSTQPPAESDVNATAFVRNIPYSATAQDLGDFFHQQFGDIKDVRILKERVYGKEYSRGLGFVEFISPESLQKALQAQNVVFQERRLTILQARPKRTYPPRNTAFVKGIPAGTKDEDLIAAFNGYNPSQAKIIRPNNDRFQGFAFVKFTTPEDLQKAIQNLKTIQLGGQQSNVFVARTNLDEPGQRRRYNGRRRFFGRRRRAPRNNNNAPAQPATQNA